LLKHSALLSEDQIIAPELILYEVTNSIWKHEHLLKDLKNGKEYLSIFYDLIEASKITILSPNEKLMQEAYEIAKDNHITLYDALFIALAIKLGLTLKTFDNAQAKALKNITKK
jgi:predicted nucleic acid-binding protein